MVSNNKADAPRIAILMEQNVEDVEFLIPYTAFRKAGASIKVLGSRMNEQYKGKRGQVTVEPNGTTTEANATEFDVVIIPGGMAPDRMRTNRKTVRFVQEAMAQGKLIAAVCHGPQVLIEGDLLRGKNATGFIAIKKDIQNAGANYIDEPLVVDGNLLTSRRPGDLPIFTSAILTRLGLSIPDTTIPDESDRNAGWWKLAQEWGGSSKGEIVDGINTAIAGERYALEVFDNYADRVSDRELSACFREICVHKRSNIQRLQERLAVLEETESFQAANSGALATLRSWFQSERDDLQILRRALGDLQTGVVDTYNLRNKFTDPATVAIFDDMEINIAQDEQRVADLYHDRAGTYRPKPPEPTTSASVKA
ncbi:MAG TPA: type 1 glutamine amidotransferase [Cyanobacteria bacterium UBA8803]|nr:type 1 glutamine amidotransferase [Cyanobacteria bacterium UBA9273]HBL57212.1 type 1 glutamine amidotransferase [Cyanobacteria bacterium UBA8803]